jgi:large subunit ribosomal protein L10
MRPEKADIVSDLAARLKGSPFILVTDYQRMKVDQFGDLRNRLAPAGADVRVVKNSFLKRAMSDSGLPDVADKLSGQTAIVMGKKDVAPVAKILKAFAAEFKIATLKIGVIDKSILSAQEIEALADLPSREILLAQLLGLLLAPATRLVRVLNEPASAFARLLKAKETSAPAPTAKGKEKQEVPEEALKGEEPVAEAKKESSAAEQPATAAETPAAESPTGETST